MAGEVMVLTRRERVPTPEGALPGAGLGRPASAWPAMDGEQLATMARMLTLQMGREQTPARNCVVTQALMAGVREPDELVLAAATDVGLTFGVRVESCGVLAWTPRMMVVGFEGTEVRRRDLPKFEFRDPVWVIWPWGMNAVDHGVAYSGSLSFREGVQAMLEQNWEYAVECLRWAAEQLRVRDARDQYLLSRALATNMALAVTGSEGGRGSPR